MSKLSTSLPPARVVISLFQILLFGTFVATSSAADTPASSPSPHKSHRLSRKSAPDENETPVAHLDSIRQSVEVQTSAGADWKKAHLNSALSASDKIRTGSKSVARLTMEDGSKVMVLQNSQAELESVSALRKSIKLIRGRVRAIVRRMKSGGSFEVKTPIGVASVRGTDFEVDFDSDGQKMTVDVNQGQVGVARLGDLQGEVILNPGEKINFGPEGDLGDPIRSGALPMNRQDVQAEMQDTRIKQGMIAAAADDLRTADYQVGKSLIDVDGARVRVEEYITRPASNAFKLVVLNERSDRFDFFTYKGTFNTTLPVDLSVALKEVSGKLGDTAPDYYLTDYEMQMSNTIDNVTDAGAGGHLVKVTYDGGTSSWVLDEGGNGTTTRSVLAADPQQDGTYRIYNPVSDNFSIVSAANLSDALKISVRDAAGTYRDLATTDTYWKTRYDDLRLSINGTLKTEFAKKNSVTHTLALDLDTDVTNPALTSVSEYPAETGSLYNRLSLYYGDGSYLTYDNYIIGDQGDIAPASTFNGLADSASYKTELDKWNYQQNISATEFAGRKIKLVIDPRIATMSGLIQ